MHDNKFNETLTPTHLMFGYEILSQKLNCSNPEKKQLDVNGLSKRMKHLHIHYNWKENDNTIRLEDISLVYNRNDKRNKWTSKDDNVRAATV